MFPLRSARSAFSRFAAAAIAVAVAISLSACASKPPRDTALGNEEERREPGAGADAYEHVARRPHVTVALAEARGLDKDEVKGATERIADRLEACARELPPSEGGVVRVVARIGDDGAVDGLNVRVEPGHAPTALRCVIAPIKLLVFNRGAAAEKRPEGSVARGLAIEAEWRP